MSQTSQHPGGASDPGSGLPCLHDVRAHVRARITPSWLHLEQPWRGSLALAWLGGLPEARGSHFSHKGVLPRKKKKKTQTLRLNYGTNTPHLFVHIEALDAYLLWYTCVLELWICVCRMVNVYLDAGYDSSCLLF